MCWIFSASFLPKPLKPSFKLKTFSFDSSLIWFSFVDLGTHNILSSFPTSIISLSILSKRLVTMLTYRSLRLSVIFSCISQLYFVEHDSLNLEDNLYAFISHFCRFKCHALFLEWQLFYLRFFWFFWWLTIFFFEIIVKAKKFQSLKKIYKK